MGSDLPQARQLFLAEALELCQQIKEGLLILSHAPTPQTHQTLMRRIQVLRQGAEQLQLQDIYLFADGLTALLENHAKPLTSQSVSVPLLHYFCDGLQFVLITHSSVVEGASVMAQREFVLQTVMPKVLEGFELLLTDTCSEPLQTRLLFQQIQCIQGWSESWVLTELQTISRAMLSTIETFPDSTLVVARVTLAGLQVACEAASQRLSMAVAGPGFSAVSQLPCPLEQGLKIFKTAHHLVGLANQTVFCIASERIEDIEVLESSMIQQADGKEQVRWRDQMLNLYRFTQLWKPRPGTEISETAPSTSAMLLILHHDEQTLAVAVEIDRLISESELQLSPPEPMELRQRCCYGLYRVSEGLVLPVIDLNWLLKERLTFLSPERTASLIQKAIQTSSGQPQPRSLSAFSFTPPQAKTILVVDDSKTVREMLSLTLREAGYQVSQAQDGQQAIENLHHHAQIDLIICDLEMSNLDGFEFLRYRLKNQEILQIPVVILSSHREDEYRHLAQKLGASDYFTIPYNGSDLVQTLKNLLT